MKPCHPFWFALGVLGCGGSRTSAQTSSEVVRPESSAASSSDSAQVKPEVYAGDAAAPGAAATNEALPVSVSIAKVHTDGHHYALDAKGPGTVKVGGAAEMDFLLAAKDGYHINDEFPYKVHASVEPAGLVSFEPADLVRAQGVYAKTEARFKLRFVGARIGEAKIAGIMTLSVCTKKECVTDKVQLEIPVSVR